MEMPRDAALWRVLLGLLQRQWDAKSDLQASEAQVAAVGVSAARSVAFQTPVMTVDTRAIAVGPKLFVHFVSVEHATRLDLLLDEYVKPVVTGAQLNCQTHTRVDQWVVSHELLQWRLERAVFPVFSTQSTERQHVASAAELARLPEPLLLCLAPFLSASEYCRLTQTNKFLNQFAENADVWRAYNNHDFPSSTPDVAPAKAAYMELRASTKLQERRRQLERQRFVEASTNPRSDIYIPLGLRQPGLIPPPFSSPFFSPWQHSNDPDRVRFEDW